MKLRVVELLLVSTLPAMVLAEGGLPSLSLTVATLIGGTLAAGSANAFNMVIESESDKLMKRTAKRPLATGLLTKSEAIIFATAIGVISLIIFQVYTTNLATILTAIAIVFYVWVYTILLKRRTSQNIVWGGAAGCMPALIGWAAVTNSLSVTAWSFFLVIFFWTPPHFWALAIKYKDDYAAAHIPMLPVVVSKTHLLRQMWVYTIAMIASSVALIVNAKLQSWAMAITIALGLVFAAQLRGLDEKSENYEKTAGKIFQWSITYLSLLSVLLVVAQLLKA
ncbi:MAG: protoheme IX farnesyltransferase [Actinobacteria bacterium]|nr:protoheme IX farnesyltransferase [Actinomycetota bacterium]MSV70436.1 protoheme IX farnesyltransferase [Actinomycetota bacterium]MSW13395.1 protoheme IX farnesyltransferase [Actinomycetota bacterium]MSX46305.1 protoheme IX farnesyltransferase [Actinomycetota bacterium]MSX90487.1 protoheme IX farnesyltransferase [Actinomycetota bacterium]